MKKNLLLLAAALSSNATLAEPENRSVSNWFGRIFGSRDATPQERKKEHEHVLTPEQEEEFQLRILRDKSTGGFRFDQTRWDECSFDPTGNYSGRACARSRQISVILQNYLAKHVYECVDAGLRELGGGSADEVHIVHDGILGDRNHSPRSLHAEARAIDVKSIDVTYTNGRTRKIAFADTANRAFYKTFRTCWGRVVNRQNGCPFYAGDPGRTGSIGWEDANHQHHMHLSVPYCVNGRYGANYFQR